jgi:ubiquinol-cytochrome c reductase cytochrome b subunit
MYKISNLLFLNIGYSKFYSFLVRYPSPMNISYLWNFGAMSGLFLVIQIVTGLFLTMFYTPHIDYAFNSVEHIMRDISYGWLVRYLHSNGASFFFLVVYIHMLRGLYYGSYSQARILVWTSGVIIYILMMGAAFLGYVLPWGQMSFWAATVITNFVTVIPVLGKYIVYWVWGGFAINNSTLNRFYSLHYLLPFVIAVISLYHIYVLHKPHSGNPLGVYTQKTDMIPFYPYFIVKDLFSFSIVLFFLSGFVFFFPELLSHSDNYIKANPLVTPPHIVPEWYFLPLYGILRSILDKTYGIVVMFGSLVCLFLLPFLEKSYIRGKMFKPVNRIMFWMFAFNFMFLGFLGSQSPTYPFIELGLICAHFHLLYIFFFIPMSILFERGFLMKLVY